MGHGAADWPWGPVSVLALPRHPLVSHQSGERAKELGKQSEESGRGLYDIIGFSSGFPAVETPWSHRCWLEFKINWVSILFHMLRECLSIRLVRTGEGGQRTYPSF